MNCKYIAIAILFLVSFDCCAGFKDRIRKFLLSFYETKVEFFDPEKNRTIHATFEIRDCTNTIPVVVRRGGVNILTFVRIPSKDNTDTPMDTIYFHHLVRDYYDLSSYTFPHEPEECLYVPDDLDLKGEARFAWCMIEQGRGRMFTVAPVPAKKRENEKDMFVRVKKEWGPLEAWKYVSSADKQDEQEKPPFRGVGLAWKPSKDDGEEVAYDEEFTEE